MDTPETPTTLLAAYDRFIAAAELTEAERAMADRVAKAASFGAAAYEMAIDQDHGAHCIARAFLAALIDPMRADLDYLRRDPESGAAARAAQVQA